MTRGTLAARRPSRFAMTSADFRIRSCVSRFLTARLKRASCAAGDARGSAPVDGSLDVRHRCDRMHVYRHNVFSAEDAPEYGLLSTRASTLHYGITVDSLSDVEWIDPNCAAPRRVDCCRILGQGRDRPCAGAEPARAAGARRWTSGAWRAGGRGAKRTRRQVRATRIRRRCGSTDGSTRRSTARSRRSPTFIQQEPQEGAPRLGVHVRVGAVRR